KNVLELGTSLGINALYLTKACSNSNVISLEGCPNTLNIAKENFQKLNAKVLTVIGEIGETLPKVLKEIEKLEFVFFDANHKKQPTLNYFNTCLPHINEHTVFIFDDIYWSKEMGEAWEQITHHPNVTLSIDLFDLGLVFFRKNQPKQHFLLRF
ncbi:MAG: class I SAM-dependent methyltransferase, partial [Bacteroidota bacterium]